MSLNNIRIVLIETSHPGNIGSAARAMLTMGLTDLYLVKPVHRPNEQSIAMASGATKVLDQIKIVDSLQEAIADCHRVIGTSARDQRSVQWPLMDARACGEFIAKQSTENKTALVFGRESSGLTNEELELCQFLVSIPVNPDFSSLNIASAVQVLSYECKMASGLVEQSNTDPVADPNKNNPLLATMDEMEDFYQHLQTTLINIRYLDAKEPRLLMRKLRCLYGRAQMTKQELGILRGVLSATLGSKFIPRNQRN